MGNLLTNLLGSTELLLNFLWQPHPCPMPVSGARREQKVLLEGTSSHPKHNYSPMHNQTWEIGRWPVLLGTPPTHTRTHTCVHTVRLPWPTQTDLLHMPCRLTCASTAHPRQRQWAGPISVLSFSSIKTQGHGIIQAGSGLRKFLVQPPDMGLHIHVARVWEGGIAITQQFTAVHHGRGNLAKGSWLRQLNKIFWNRWWWWFFLKNPDNVWETSKSCSLSPIFRLPQ